MLQDSLAMIRRYLGRLDVNDDPSLPSLGWLATFRQLSQGHQGANTSSVGVPPSIHEEAANIRGRTNRPGEYYAACAISIEPIVAVCVLFVVVFCFVAQPQAHYGEQVRSELCQSVPPFSHLSAPLTSGFYSSSEVEDDRPLS